MIAVWEFQSVQHHGGEGAAIHCTVVGCDAPECDATFVLPESCDTSLSSRAMKALASEGWTTDADDHDLCPAHRECVIEEGDR